MVYEDSVPTTLDLGVGLGKGDVRWRCQGLGACQPERRQRR